MCDSINLDFRKVNAGSSLSGKIRVNPSDFRVDEIQSFTPSGEGEHVWLKIKKTGENTDWVAKQLAQIANVARRDVSYAGMKDRNAVTTQWFSVQMPGREAPDWQAELQQKKLDSIEVLESHRHLRKLKRGALKGNQFSLLLREFKGTEVELANALATIKQDGVPNYYGVQRFGHSGLNVKNAGEWFSAKFKVKDRNKRSIYLSAARSYIFNQILEQRVIADNWNKGLDGDVFMLAGSNSIFTQTVDNEIMQRIAAHDIHPSGALWGRGSLASDESVLVLEQQIASKTPVLCKGLESNGLQQERRALRLSVADICYSMLAEDQVLLEFSLPAGTYATSVLQEIGLFE